MLFCKPLKGLFLVSLSSQVLGSGRLSLLCTVTDCGMLEHRLNYGTIFQEQPKLYSTSELCAHLFVIDLHGVQTVKMPNCNCPSYSSLMIKITELNKDTMSIVTTTKQHILTC